ncbi:MAG TPA: transposase [Chloroflexota bacterium]
MPRAPRTVLTPEQKQEIVSLYTDTDTPVKEIASTYGIADTHPFAILNEFGVRWRRGDRTPESRTGPKRELPPHIAAMQEVHVAEPTPAPEPKLTVEAAIRELPPIAPQEQDAAPNGLEPEPDLEGWRVRVEGTLLLHGSLENVLKQIRRNHPLLKVKSLEVVE